MINVFVYVIMCVISGMPLQKTRYPRQKISSNTLIIEFNELKLSMPNMNKC